MQMARPLRLEFPGAVYHVTSRGDRQEDIYGGDDDRKAFLDILGEVCERYNWVCYAYCLMSNHYHLIIETPDANLSKGMRQLNGVYTQLFNRSYSRVGHVFQGRYKAIHVDRDNYLLELLRYVVLNPVRARMVRSAANWPWSSYRSTCGEGEQPTWLETEWTLSAFGKRKRTAIERYKQFVSEGKNQPSPWENLKRQVFLGDDAYIEKMQGLIDGDKELSEIPISQRRPEPKSLKYYETKSRSRDEGIRIAYASGGYTQKEIGQFFGLHYTSISRILSDKK